MEKDVSSKNTTQDDNDSDNNLLSDLEYWQPSGRRIFQGKRQKITRYPFVASIQFFKKFQCGGSIIKSDLVITSASCLQLAYNNRFFRENPAFLSVQVGCELYEGGDENIPIQEVYFHPEYDPKNLRNNLAIMRLHRVLRFGKRVKKIKKIDFDREPSPLPANIDGITIIGWGAKSSSNIIKSVWSNRLSSALLDFYPLKECQDVYSKEFVTHKNFCAGFFSKGGGACNRDAGGPGIAHGILLGVVSFGSPNCGAPDSPTVFTKLGYYRDWIEEILEMEIKTNKIRTTLRSTRETYKVEHYMTTKSVYALEPVTQEGDSYGIARSPIYSTDALRSLNDNNLFKDFVITMFGSEEAKEYLDQYENEKDTSTDDEENLNIEADKVLNMIRINTRPTTVPTSNVRVSDDNKSSIETDKDYNSGSVEMVSTLGYFDETPQRDSSSDESRTTPKLVVNYAVASESTELLEADIAKLIDEIDIQKLLESGLSDSSADFDKESKSSTTTQSPTNKRVTESKTYEDTSDDDDEYGDGEDDDDDDDDVNDKAGDRFLHLIDSTHKVTEGSQKRLHQKQHQQKQHQPKQHKQKQHQRKQHKSKLHQTKQHQRKQSQPIQHQPKQVNQQKLLQQQQLDQELRILDDSLKDYNIGQNYSYSSGGILDILSQSDLMRLLKEVVADATNGSTSNDNSPIFDLFGQ
ncbi:unnamed protein product [Spodoptera exigua]|nr:unnamed protein product [Spodoptera exigua]